MSARRLLRCTHSRNFPGSSPCPIIESASPEWFYEAFFPPSGQGMVLGSLQRSMMQSKYWRVTVDDEKSSWRLVSEIYTHLPRQMLNSSGTTVSGWTYFVTTNLPPLMYGDGVPSPSVYLPSIFWITWWPINSLQRKANRWTKWDHSYDQFQTVV